jgi:hypothetical protein
MPSLIKSGTLVRAEAPFAHLKHLPYSIMQQSILPQRTIYRSVIPDLYIPKHSAFEHILPSIEIHNGENLALIDGITGETISRHDLRRRALTLAAAMVDELGLRGTHRTISLVF